jgi:hypothetical protein
MKRLFLYTLIAATYLSCNTNSQSNNTTSKIENTTDSSTYPFKAHYSSDLSMSGHSDYAHKVLTVWKMYENNQIDSMKPFYADTVTYDDARGNHYHGPSEGLLQIAKGEMAQLDSLRFDIDMWETVHSNDKNEDWVNIWCKERDYPKTGKADTALMYEQWKIKDGRIYYFNQYFSKLPKTKN